MNPSFYSIKRMFMVIVIVLALLCIYVKNTSADGYKPGLAMAGPRTHYLALGDSLAFGFQPDLQFYHGYVDDFSHDLRQHGMLTVANMGCIGESTDTFVNGGCPFAFLHRISYSGSQLRAALQYLARYRGQVSPVTLDIGGNDLLTDIDVGTCRVDRSQFNTDLADLDTNLTRTILPQLHAALIVGGQVTGDLLLMNYYNPYQNACPNTVPLLQTVNQHLAHDLAGYGTMVDVFEAFGGAATPNPHVCAYTWICSIFGDVHASTQGYSLIAGAFEKAAGY